MQIIVLADDKQRRELCNDLAAGAGVVFVNHEADFLHHSDAAVFMDLSFINEDSRKALLARLLPKPVIVNSVADTLAQINPSFVRINGWATFLSSPLIEASCSNDGVKKEVEGAFSVFNKRMEWLPDEPGFVAARVVSMMVNEACLAVKEGVSTKEEINTAMKLGTAYPYGPFEWAEKIGVHNVVALLKKLSATEPRYTPSDLLVGSTPAS